MNDSAAGGAVNGLSSAPQTIQFLMRGAGLLYGATLYSLLARLLATFIVANALGSGALGVYALCFATVQILSMLVMCGQDAGLVRFVSLAVQANDLARARALLLTAMATGLLLSVPVMLGGWLVLPFFITTDDAANANVVPFFVLSVLPLVWSGMLGAFGLARGRRVVRALPDRVVGATVQLVLSFAALQFGLGLWGVSLAYWLNALASLATAIVLVMPLLPRRVANVSLVPVARELMGFSWKLGLSNVLGYVLLNAALFVLGVTNAAQAGVYAAASRLTLPGLLFLDAIGSVFGPHAARKLGDPTLEADLQRVTNWLIVASAPIFILLFVFADTWMSLLGPEFAGSGNVLAVMALAQMVNILTSACNTLISLSHRPDLKILNTVLAWGTNLVLVLALTPQWGALGAAYAYFVAVVIIDVLEYGETRLVLQLRPWGALSVKPALMIVSMTLMLMWFANAAARELWQVLAVGVGFLLSYISLMMWFGLPRDDVSSLRAIAANLRGRS